MATEALTKAKTKGPINDPIDRDETGDATQNMVSHFLEHSTVKANGVREVSKAGLSAALLTQGVSDVDVKKVQGALDMATTAATMLAADDLETKIGETPKDKLKDDTHRRGLVAEVRLPTHGGKTTVKVSAETVNNIPFRGEGAEGPSTKTTYGRVSTSISATGRIHKDLPGSISDRVKAALGVKG